MSKKQRPNRTGDVWDVKGRDVPRGRVTRALMKGLSGASDAERDDLKRKRRAALDLLRAQAKGIEDSQDREALWDLVPKIGFAGYPSWEEVSAARSEAEFLKLAYRGELHMETEARRDRDAQISERRTCAHSVGEYMDWREREEFAAESNRTVVSLLRRMLKVNDPEGVPYGQRKVATLGYADADQVMSDLAESDRLPEGQVIVQSSTRDKQQRTLIAWFAWELQRERERAADQGRSPLYLDNPFESRKRNYSKPSRRRHQTLVEKEESRRFYPDEIKRLEEHACVHFEHGIPIIHRMGLRPGELIHLRWLLDVTPLPGGAGYEVRIQGGRSRDTRCSCPSCRSAKGWAPKNGPRRYILDRKIDRIDWISHACDALDHWINLRDPQRGDYLFPSPVDHSRAMRNAELNSLLRNAGNAAGIETGLRAPGRRTAHSFRHACASEMLERGVPHQLAAAWIGDTLQAFEDTYGRPDPAHVARITLAGLGAGSSDNGA